MPQTTLAPRRLDSKVLQDLARLLGVGCLAAAAATPASAQDPEWAVPFGMGSRDGHSKGLDVVPADDGTSDYYVCGIVDASSYVFGYGLSLPGYPIVEDQAPGRYEDAFLARYDADGVPLWVRFGRGPKVDRAKDLTVLPSGDVLVAGNFNYWVNGVYQNGIRFDTDGSPTSPDVFLPASNATLSPAAFVACYAPDGQLQFARSLTPPDWGASISDVAALPDGDFVVVGGYRGGTTFGDAADPSPITLPGPPSVGFLSGNGFVARYAPNGDIRWIEIVESPAADGIYAVEALPSGDVILIGETSRRTSFDTTLLVGHPDEVTLPRINGESTFVLRLDLPDNSSSSVAWYYTFGGPGAALKDAHQVAVGPAGELYITGELGGDAADPSGGYVPTPYRGTFGTYTITAGFGEPHAYLARLDPGTGVPLWTGGTSRGIYGSEGDPPSIAPTVDGVVFAQRAFATLVDAAGTTWFSTGWGAHAKWDSNGNPVWARRDLVGHKALTALHSEGCVITTGSTRNGYLDYGLPTQLKVPGPRVNLGFIARIDAAPATSLTVPPDMTPSCDPGTNGATVNFLVEVVGAAPDSTLEVVDTTTGSLLLSAASPSGQYGVGPLFVPIGVTTIEATLRDPSGAVLRSGSFRITVEDLDPPVLSGCGDATIECTSHETLLLGPVLGITATDHCDPAPALTFAPASVGLGSTVVTATARDASGNTTTCDFTVTVVDTTPPEFTLLPDDIERECVDGHPLVAFDIEARDACGEVELVCVDDAGAVVDPTGTHFLVGVHTVTCTATDPSGNSTTASFTITVYDNTAPLLVAPDSLVLPNDPGTCEAVATFAAVVSDDCDPEVGVVYTIADGTEVFSGDAFPHGTTVVTCRAEDFSGNAATSDFSITVLDVEAPVIVGGGGEPLVTDCAGSPVALAFADLGVTVTDNCPEMPVVSFSPSVLSPGTTWVQVTARDASGNEAWADIPVTVLRGPFELELQRPLDPNVDNRIHAGSVTPLKVRVACNNLDVADATVVIDGIELLDASGTPIVNETIEDPGLSQDDGSTFVLTGDAYRFNLSTKSWDDTSGARHLVRVRVQRAGHVDTLLEIPFVNK